MDISAFGKDQEPIPLSDRKNPFLDIAVNLPEPSFDLGFDESPGRSSHKSQNGADLNWLEMKRQGISDYQIGKRVYAYCEANPKTRAFVFFSLQETLVFSIVSHLSSVSGLKVVFAINLELSPVGTENVIELCYGDKPFFDDNAKRKMARERFTLPRTAFVIFYSWVDHPDKLRGLKVDLRALLPNLSFERRIHGTDGVEDTLCLAEAVTNPHTLALLNRVSVSRNDRVFERIPVEFRNNPNICVDGSSVMELYSLRKSRDLDIICRGDDLIGEVLKRGYDVNNDHYKWLPVTFEQVIEDPYLHAKLYGVKFTTLEMRGFILSNRHYGSARSLSAKKLRDLQLISDYLGGAAKTRANLPGLVGTLVTQLRLLFELAIVRLVPKLPPRLAKLLRGVWHLIRGRLRSVKSSPKK